MKRWRLGHAVAAERQRRLLAEEGPRPAQAVAESLAALNAMEAIEAMAYGPGHAMSSPSEAWSKFAAGGRRFRSVRSSKPKPVAAENRLAKALAEIASALHATNVPWMVIGGIAIIARGVRRMTTDIDVVVRGDETTPAALLRALATRRIVPRIDNAEAFARERLVLLLCHEPTGVDFDLSFGWTTFEHEALEARSDVAYGSVVAPMARAEDLVIFKAMAARPKDIEDAAALILMHKDINIDRVRRHLAELAALAEEPSLTSGLEAVIKLVSASRSSTAKTEQKRKASSSRTPKAKRPTPEITAKTKSKNASKPRRAKRRRPA